ncbi:hypothetical protein [Rhizobium sp. P44RR-XXIV]|uniref:hypothetical protein n=1 Tax=Rhizobium sp. P44RR-XXIV TaxID=1921145 RepID=UPI000987CEB7|nr:hypothetical protein [Rhizobium sp. P44RR-XXIV]TIX92102.1 hypothetical protein BSK43_006820 [Rhizobium sp. P44RR-XXIV]
MKILATALVALGILALPATYAEARDYHRWHHHGPVMVEHHRHDHGWDRHHGWDHHHRWDRRYHSKPHFSHN